MGVLVIAFSFASADAFAQDFNQSKKNFKQAVVEQNSMTVASLATEIAGFNTREAVDTLIWGYDYYAQLLVTLWRDRTQLQLQQETYEDFMIEYKKLVAEIEDRKKKGLPGDPALNDRITKFNKKTEDFQKVKEQLTQVEVKINDINRIKSSIVGALAKFNSDQAVGELVNDLKKASAWTTRAAVAEALGQIDHASALPALRERLIKGESESGAIVAVLDALAKKNQWDPETISAAALHLESTYWQVRLAATTALKSSKSPHAIEPLISALDKADGRMKHEIHDALVAVTGVDKGLETASWKGWFDSNKESLLGGSYKPKADEGFQSDGKAKATTVEFYGIPVKSKNVIFILDRSGSMAEPGAFNEEEERVQYTGGDKKVSSEIAGLRPAGTRKIDIAKYQLKKVLLLLPKGTKFNIVFFNHTFTIMAQSMVSLDDSTRKSAFNFFEPLEPEGQTDPWQALSKAFDFCAEPGPNGKLKREGADTIYLMSDGLPFPPGKVVGPDEIVTRTRDWNQLRKIIIHTVFVSAEGTTDYDKGIKFMEQLAKENGGIFKAPKQPKPPGGK